MGIERRAFARFFCQKIFIFICAVLTNYSVRIVYNKTLQEGTGI